MWSLKLQLKAGLFILILISACQPQPAFFDTASIPLPVPSASYSVPVPQATVFSAVQQPNFHVLPAHLPAEVLEDLELKAAVGKYLESLIPGVQEKLSVSALSHTHAAQIALSPQNTEYRVQAQYSPVPPSVLQFLMLRQGIYASDNLLSAYFLDGDRARLLERLQQKVKASLGPIPYTHYGLAALRYQQRWVVSLVLLSELVALEGIQLEYPKPIDLTVRGTLLAADFHQPEALMTYPDGHVEKLPLNSQGRSFSLPLQLKTPGLYSFEINLTGPWGPQPATNFVLAVAQPYPLASSEPEVAPTPLPDLSRLRQHMLELVNRDRQAMGVRPLYAEENLDQAAQQHSQEMIALGYVGHISPLHGGPQKQVARSGVSEPVAQNISLSRSPESAQRELMSSPGHRLTIIRPEWTHVGFGVAQSPDGFLYITQNFIQRRVVLQPLPTRLKRGEPLQINATPLESGVWLGFFLDGQIQGEPLEVQAGQTIQKKLEALQPGPHQLRIGLSPPPIEQSYTFSFTNFWDFEVE